MLSILGLVLALSIFSMICVLAATALFEALVTERTEGEWDK